MPRTVLIAPMLLVASFVLAACADQPIGEHDGAAVEVHAVSVSHAAGHAKQSAGSRPSGPMPDIHLTGSYSAATGTGSAIVSQSGSAAHSPEDTATPTALSWTTTTITVTYAGETRTYDLDQHDQDLFQDLQNEAASAQGASAPQGSAFRALLSREGLTLEEAHSFFASQGYAVRHLDADRLEVRDPLASLPAGAGAATHEVRHVFNVRTREIERSDLYRDGEHVYSHGPSRLWPEGARRAP